MDAEMEVATCVWLISIEYDAGKQLYSEDVDGVGVHSTDTRQGEREEAEEAN